MDLVENEAVFDEDDLPVVGNVPHPIMYGRHRVNITHPMQKEILDAVSDEDFWMSLYVMHAEVFGTDVHRRQIPDFVGLVQRSYFAFRDVHPSQISVLDNHKTWTLWIIHSWIRAASGDPEPPKPHCQFTDIV